MIKGTFKKTKFFNEGLICKPEFVYTLGYMWADGYISKSGSTIGIEILEDDAKLIKDIFCRFIPWHISSRRRIARREQTTFRIGDGEFKKFLYQYDFDKKAYISPCRILNLLSIDMRKMFFRGIIDGDGCIYIGGASNNQLSITSSFDQDWIYFSDLCQQLNIIGKVRRVTTKNGNSYSQFRITKKIYIIQLYKYLYVNTKLPEMGLQRKINKFKTITI